VGGAVAKNSRPGDIILFLGAGDITLEAHKYAALLDGAKGQS
jgi:UDP-N-acetylmuramate-alanine ligase